MKNVRLSTKGLVAALTAFGALMQVPAVSGFVYKLTAAHPNVAGALTALVASHIDRKMAMDAGAQEVLRAALERFPQHAGVQQRCGAALQALSFQLQ